jgi:hypothetical protein
MPTLGGNVLPGVFVAQNLDHCSARIRMAGMYLRLKTTVIAPDGKRKFLGMFGSSERIAAAITREGVSAGWQVEIELHDFGKIPHQLTPGSTRLKMNGKPLK